jgi:prepilin-type N-terminal cleavage/methylation domain-containing protein
MTRNVRTAFTLVELLVVVGIIAILVAILLPSLIKARESAIRVACMSNLHQAHIGLTMYAQDYRGRVPPWGYNGFGTAEYANTGGFWNGTTWAAGTGLGVAYPRYINSYKILYCPTSPRLGYAQDYYWKPSPYESPSGGGGSLGYVYLAGIGISGHPSFTDNGFDVRRKISEPSRCIMGDELYITSGFYLTNHPSQDIGGTQVAPDGANFLYTDGTVRWSVCRRGFSAGTGWLNAVFVDGQGWAISGKL